MTKSVKKEHLDDNINLGEFHIEDADMKVLGFNFSLQFLIRALHAKN